MKRLAIIAALYSLPLLAFAATSARSSYIGQVILALGKIINQLTVLIVGLALVTFFWGLAKYILKAGDKGAVDEGKNLMIWGVVALFVMVSVWGLVRLLEGALGKNVYHTSFSTDNPIPCGQDENDPCY